MRAPATTIAERLWIERLRLDVSVEDFATLSGVAPRTVRQWEDADGPVPFECWEAWAKAGVDGQFVDNGLPSEGQLLLLQSELLSAFVERRIVAALALLPAAQARAMLVKLAARENRKAGR